MSYPKKDYYSNDLTPAEEAEVVRLLNNGYAVRISSDCLGHTRANMVKNQGLNLFSRLGAVRVEEETHGLGGYYALK